MITRVQLKQALEVIRLVVWDLAGTSIGSMRPMRVSGEVGTESINFEGANGHDPFNRCRWLFVDHGSPIPIIRTHKDSACTAYLSRSLQAIPRGQNVPSAHSGRLRLACSTMQCPACIPVFLLRPCALLVSNQRHDTQYLDTLASSCRLFVRLFQSCRFRQGQTLSTHCPA